MGRGGFKVGAEPGFECGWADVEVREGGEVGPDEGEVGLGGGDFLGDGVVGGAEVFHVEHEVQLVAGLALLEEADLGGEEVGADPGVEAGLLLELPGECVRGGLAELDVPAGKVVVPVLAVLAEEDTALVDEDAAGNDFDGLGLRGHGGHDMV